MLPLLTLVLGIIEFGWIFNQQVSLSNASREAARFYAVHQSQPFDAGLCAGSGDWTSCAVARGKAAAPTVDWSTGSLAVTNTCGAASKEATAVADIAMPSLTGFFDFLTGERLTAEGKMLCGG